MSVYKINYVWNKIYSIDKKICTAMLQHSGPTQIPILTGQQVFLP